jgi:hypothetical protein
MLEILYWVLMATLDYVLNLMDIDSEFKGEDV